MHRGSFPFAAADDTRARGQAERRPVRPWCGAFVWGGRVRGYCRLQDTRTLYRRSDSEEEPLNTGGKEKYTFFFFFTLTEKETLSNWWYLDLFKSQNTQCVLRRTEAHFLTCWTNQSIFRVNQTISFQSRVLFLASGCPEKNGRKMYL